MNAPRSAPRLLVATFALYGRYPLLFLALAAGVIVPYELISLAVTGTGAFSGGDVSLASQLPLSLIDWFVITPLVSALHIHAIADAKHGHEPRIGTVALRGLKVVPVVAAATIISGLGIALGFLALIVPGIVLMLRWAVVAQAAAIEHEGWLPALRRSHQLTAGHYLHIFAFLVITGMIAGLPLILGSAAFASDGVSVAAFLGGLAIVVITASFAALASALLYYDLLARLKLAGTPDRDPRPSPDPRDYSDNDRPKGWYVDPKSPGRMLHWGGPDSPVWSSSTRTPRKIKQEWLKKNRN